MLNLAELENNLKSDNGILRNKTAIDIMDSCLPCGFKLLIDAAINPKDGRNYGTIVYAMSAFDCSKYVDILIELMTRDNFEVCNTAADIIVNQL